MEITAQRSLQEKLHILADAAKYDVACTSSGVDRRGKKGYLGNSAACGICHSFASDGRCVSLLKILLTNHCIYDCKYCMNRVSNDIVREEFTPREICEITMEFYRRNYIEGLFLSSGVLRNPVYTMERICETLHLLRTVYRFNGYIHVKAIPGAPEELIARVGYLADRMSINLELPTEEGMKRLAPNKTHAAILRPMRMMTNTIAEHRLAIGKDARMERSTSNRYLQQSIFRNPHVEELHTATPSYIEGGKTVRAVVAENTVYGSNTAYGSPPEIQHRLEVPAAERRGFEQRPFATAGQSTQMIIGATQETDFHLLKTTQYLYQTYDLKRVFFSAYVPLNEDSVLPSPDTPVPLLREHRLYQADWLLRFYGFQADELLSTERPNFNEQLDPKCDWALRHLEQFPVEINTAPYDLLLRIPGVGPRSATRIIQARRYGKLDFSHLKKMGVVLKRAHYFILCQGQMMYKIPVEEEYITRQLVGSERTENWKIAHGDQSFHQMSLFDDFHIKAPGTEVQV
ncbi:MAG: putative DNA modification/repair radical SAM protein [Eubacteriales bacterium]|nr:putative DNA modification/repair radical SAM protein [Eubacteriales bacterium]